ncbi:hypothetical protein F5884DRAFT_882572 [Xylogone sp. PMI_703]|nr:hypothetical protein F5884DRAFT_882572 [Xylogone sp. PMI_703]
MSMCPVEPEGKKFNKPLPDEFPEDFERHFDRAEDMCNCIRRYRVRYSLRSKGEGGLRWEWHAPADYGSLGELFPTEEHPTWYAIAIYNLLEHRLPHLKCSMIYDASGDECSDVLLLGELITLISLIFKHMKYRGFTGHTAPVLLFSYMGPNHGRIIHAHMSTDGLVVQSSRMYDFTGECDAYMQLFAQWGLSSAVRVTELE